MLSRYCKPDPSPFAAAAAAIAVALLAGPALAGFSDPPDFGISAPSLLSKEPGGPYKKPPLTHTAQESVLDDPEHPLGDPPRDDFFASFSDPHNFGDQPPQFIPAPALDPLLWRDARRLFGDPVPIDLAAPAGPVPAPAPLLAFAAASLIRRRRRR